MSALQFPEYNIFHLSGLANCYFILLDAIVKRTVFLIFFPDYSFIILLNNILSARKLCTDSSSPRIQCVHEGCDLTLSFLTYKTNRVIISGLHTAHTERLPAS